MITYRKTISIIQNSSINPFSNAHHKVLSHSGIRYTLPKINCQNANGTWAKPGSSDQARSPGVINLLTWYYEHIHHDPRVARAVRRFDAFILNPRESKAWGLLGSGAATKKWNGVTVDVARSLTGRALADIVEPGVDARW